MDARLRLRPMLRRGVVLLASLQLGCHAPAPVAAPAPASAPAPISAPAPVPAPLVTEPSQDLWRQGELMWPDPEQYRADRRQFHCVMVGIVAEALVGERERSHPSLAEVLAKFDAIADQHRDTPQISTQAAAFRQLAMVVYAHPTWTRSDAKLYAEQECLRTSP
jgi:hypothetical protein